MSKPKMPECFYRGEYIESNPKCQKCKVSDDCKQIRQSIRSAVIRKLDSGTRQYVVGHLWSRGDSLASSPITDELRLIMDMEAYMAVYGLTDCGLTGLAETDIYDKVVEYHSDLIAFLDAMKEWDKCKNDAEFEVRVEATLTKLEKKYSEKTGQKISGDPKMLLQTLKDIIYREIYPKIMAQTTLVASLESRGNPMFNPSNVPRFRRPDIDRGRKE